MLSLFICIKLLANTTVSNSPHYNVWSPEDFTFHLCDKAIDTTVIGYIAMKILIVGLVLFALGSASAAVPLVPPLGAWYIPPGFGTTGKELTDETATSQVFPVALIPVLVAAAPKVVALALDLLRYAVCNKTNTDPQLQDFAGSEEENARIMALVNVMNDLLTAEDKLDEVMQLNVKSNLVARAELFDGQWFSTLKSKLKSTIYKIGGAAKKLLCKQ